MADEDEGPAIKVHRSGSYSPDALKDAAQVGGIRPTPAFPAPAPPPAAPPAAAPAAAPAGGLELGRPTKRSVSNPELDAWNRQISTGEFRVDELQKAAGEGDRVSALAHALPTTNTEPEAGGPGHGVKIAVAVAVALVLLGIGGKVALSKIGKKGDGDVAAEVGDDEFVRKMQAAGENAPDCWVSDDGYSFVYKDKAGERKRVGAIAEVPVLYRKAAVCVPD